MSARMTHGAALAAALLLAWPAMAQQAPAADPHHPGGAAATAAPSAAQPAPAASVPAAPAPGGGMGMMGMMGGQGGMPMMMGGDDRRPGMGMGMMRRHGPYGTPMNVIINVGPDIHVDVEDQDGRRTMGRPGMGGGGTPGMMGGGMPMRGMQGGAPQGAGMGEQLHDLLAERVEGGLAFLRAELRIRADQEVAWTAFATKIREAATRFREARGRIPAVALGAGLEQHFAAQEARLTAELERARACRAAAATLMPALDDGQRRTVEALAWLILPGSPGPMARGMAGPAR